MPATPQAGSGGDEQWGAAIMTPPRADASGRTWAANQQISAPAVQLTGLDKTKALKVVGAHPELSRATKSIGTLLVEHYNIRTHRCDPGLERLARQSGFSSRTVRRAIDSFEEVGLIHSDRHGGHNLTSSYTLNWDLIRLLADKFESRAPDWWRSDKAANSVTEERTILSETGDRNVHQNPGRNLEKETLCAEPKTGTAKRRIRNHSLSKRLPPPSGTQRSLADYRQCRPDGAHHSRIPKMSPPGRRKNDGMPIYGQHIAETSGSTGVSLRPLRLMTLLTRRPPR